VPRFDEHLRKAVESYRRRQTIEGGWGEDRFEGAPASIVNTCEVLAVMRAARVRYDEPTIQDALMYLARAVVDHPKRRGSTLAARGENTRYCAWGLAGLTLYDQARHDVGLADAHEACVAWLSDHELNGAGAWGEVPNSEHPSLLSTSAALRGLQRLCGYHPAAAEARRLVSNARRQIRGLTRETGQMAGWAQTPRERSISPSATAMAVLMLSEGDFEDGGLAIRGARWLLAHVRDWGTMVEPDASARGANWHHMTFSLGLRAILATGVATPEHRSLRETISYLTELWLPDEAEWSHGRPGARPSPSGSYAVVLAHNALRRAWPFDIDEALHGWRRRTAPAEAPPEVQIAVGADREITVTDLDGRVKLTARLRPALHHLFMELAVRHEAGAAQATLDARSLSTEELALALEVTADTVRRNAQKVNVELRKAAESGGESVGDLIQLMSVTGDPGNRRWILAVDRATTNTPTELCRD
jgi:hypothetical protein